MMTDRKIIASAEVVSEILRSLNASAAIIYLILLGHRNGRTGECYVTQATIAEEANINDRTVRRKLNDLKEAGFLDWKQGSSFSSKANSYIFLKEVFDAEGKGEALEAKKIKAKNKEQKIIENSKKNECKVIPMPIEKRTVTAPDISKAPSMPPRKSPITFNSNKVPPAPPKAIQEVQEKQEAKVQVKSEVKKEKSKMPAEIKSLLKEYKSLLNKRNEMIKIIGEGELWPDTLSNTVKDMIERGKIEAALNEIRCSIEEIKEKSIKSLEKKIREKEFNERISTITPEEALKVYNTLKQELTKRHIEMIEERLKYLNNPGSAKSLVIGVKNAVEAKGLEFDLNKILVA